MSDFGEELDGDYTYDPDVDDFDEDGEYDPDEIVSCPLCGGMGEVSGLFGGHQETCPECMGGGGVPRSQIVE